MKEYSIVKAEESLSRYGCDFTVVLGEDRKNTPLKLLQLTDMQIIDSSQRRTPDRIRADEIEAWEPGNFDIMCADHIRALVAESDPDLIFITGDIVYGSFDDSGRVFQWFADFMDSLMIPWAPVFGNHDNESKMGVAWQCEVFEKCKYCLFSRGEVSGNSNYSVGISVGGELVRVLHMLDSNGCKNGDDPSLIKEKCILPDQLRLVEKTTERVYEINKKRPPAFMAYHIPTDSFRIAERAKGYLTDERRKYNIGVDTPALDGDFGFIFEDSKYIEMGEEFIDFVRGQWIDGVFVGHLHNTCTSILYKDVRWVFGLKTGQYDYHVPGQTGGTLITLFGEGFTVMHLPSLVRPAPMPREAKMFRNLFVTGEEKRS